MSNDSIHDSASSVNPTPEILILFADLWAHLQVPASVGMLDPQTREDWVRIKNHLDIFGWVTPAEVFDAIVKSTKAGQL